LFIDPSGRVLTGYPDIARSYSGGAHNVPIYPHFPFIALTTVTVASLASLLFIVLRHRDDLMSAGACVYAGLVLIAERAAFGAAEPSHFGYFGLPAFFVALFVVTANRITRRRAWLAGILLVGIVIPMQYYYAMEFVPFFTRR